MAISVRCSECDAVFRLSDEKAGKKIRCRDCGTVIPVIDELVERGAEDRPVRRVSGTRQRRPSRHTQQPPWIAIGGISAAVLVVVLIVFVVGGLSGSSTEWVADPVVAAMLGNEVNLNGYVIRPPRGWPVSYSETNGVVPTVKYTWQSPAGDEKLELEFKKDARYQPNYEPIVITQQRPLALVQTLDVYIFHGATHDRGTINGQKFQRIFSPKEKSFRATEARSIYLAYLAGMKIELQVASQYGEASASFKSLEAAALSFRIGMPSDPRAVPVQQLLPANGNVPTGIPSSPRANNMAANGGARPTALNNGNEPATAPFVAKNNPNPVANPIVKKSGAIPELSNAGFGRGSLLSYTYQRPEFPGVFHIYPDESYQPRVVIPLPSSNTAIIRPITVSEFLLVGSQVWNWKTAEQVAALEFKIDHSDFIAISPDGKLVAYRNRSQENVPIGIFSTGERNQTVELDARKGDARLVWLGFLDATRLMVVWSGWNDTRDNAVQIWDATTGEGLSAFGLGPFDHHNMSVSSDGEQLLFCTSDTVGYVSLRQKKPKPTTLPLPDRRALGRVNGLAFSPDNSRAATYRGGLEGVSILEWDVAKKKIVQNGTIPINSHDIAFIGQADSFQWTPDGEHWLLKGHLMLDCKTGNPLWMLQSLFAMHASPIMLDQETLLVPVQSKNREYFLVSVPFPWDKVRRAVDIMNDKSQPALLRPGNSVSMEFSPGPLRFMAADQMAQVLGQPLAERMKSFGIKVAANQPTVLYLKYQEQTGDQLQVVEKRTPFDFRGTPTGQSVNETKYQLEIGWKQSGTDRILWKTTSQGSTGRSSNSPNISDQSIHQEMVDRLKRQLSSLMVPYFIPEDDSVSLLPVISTR